MCQTSGCRVRPTHPSLQLCPVVRRYAFAASPDSVWRTRDVLLGTVASNLGESRASVLDNVLGCSCSPRQIGASRAATVGDAHADTPVACSRPGSECGERAGTSQRKQGICGSTSRTPRGTAARGPSHQRGDLSPRMLAPRGSGIIPVPPGSPMIPFVVQLDVFETTTAPPEVASDATDREAGVAGWPRAGAGRFQ